MLDDFTWLSYNFVLYPPDGSDDAIQVTRKSMARLDDGEFFDDVLIDFYMKFLDRETPNQGLDRSRRVLCSTLYHKREQRKLLTKNEIAKVGLLSRDVVYVPINSQSHWFLAVIVTPFEANGCILILDSIAEKLKPNHWSVYRNLIECLSREFAEKMRMLCKYDDQTVQDLLETDDSTIGNIQRLYLRTFPTGHRAGFAPENLFAHMQPKLVRTPQQQNGCDCGVFLVHNVKKLLQLPLVELTIPNRQTWYSQEDVSKTRHEMKRLLFSMHKEQFKKVEAQVC